MFLRSFIAFLAVISAAFTSISAQGFTESFEDYNAGDYVVVSSEHFDTWVAGGGGTIGDALITDAMATEGVNSLEIEQTNALGGDTDVLLLIGEIEGNWGVNFDMQMVGGAGGYFNLQGTADAGSATESWQLNFATDGSGNAAIDGPWGTASTTLAADAWHNIDLVVDLDQGLMQMSIDDEVLFQTVYAGILGSVNFFAYTGGTGMGHYYVDNITVAPSSVVLQSVIEANLNFSFGPNPTASELRIETGVYGAEMTLYALTGQALRTQRLDSPVQQVTLDLPEGVYLLEVAFNGHREMRKVVVSR
ncbi:MAG: T9SS type A sorting domain-containing protein [Flavobacteriales bacterium]|nr:T9SS type A sorting domain-containing protein [Flavobacteriales bacterium]